MVGTETNIDQEISDIVADSVGGRRLSENECVRLMGCPEDSPEGRLIMRSADAMARRLCGNTASIGVQIGVITGPCVADCGFCSFAMSTTKADDYVMPPDVLEGYLREAVDSGIVDSVSLMTIHNIELDDLLDAVATAKAILPDDIGLCVNTGDLTFGEMLELRDAGVSKAYHALRIGEGDDTRLNPLDRFNTVRNFVRAGLQMLSRQASGRAGSEDVRYGRDHASASGSHPVRPIAVDGRGRLLRRPLRRFRAGLRRVCRKSEGQRLLLRSRQREHPAGSFRQTPLGRICHPSAFLPKGFSLHRSIPIRHVR